MIPVFKPAMGEEEIEAVAGVIRSGWIGLGPKTAAFEEEFARFSQVDHAVALNSCTAALDLAMRLLGVGQGGEVIVPTMTFVSTAHAVSLNGAMPIFADVDQRTLCVDPNDVAQKITPRTRAIVVVHYGGRPADLDRLAAVAGKIPIIEDCAHAAGARFKGRPVGGLGALGCFSFHAVKNIATGDGGMLTLNNAEWARRAQSLRWLGIDRSTWDRAKQERRYWWRYGVDEIGLKCHMNDIAAAIGLVQLKRLAHLNERRRAIAQQYFEGLSGLQRVQLPLDDDDTFKSSWHLFCIRCDRRDELSSHLASNGVSTGVHYAPIHSYDCYGNRPTLPTAEREFERMLTLPLFPDLEDGQVQRIIDLIRDFYRGR